MALLKRKRPPEPVSPTRLRSLPDGDLYLFMEGALMTAQQRLAESRHSEVTQRPALLAVLQADLDAAAVGCQEMRSRV